MEAILVKSNNTVSKIASETVSEGRVFKIPILFRTALASYYQTLPNKREAENTLAITPEKVAIIAIAMVIQEPHSPKWMPRLPLLLRIFASIISGIVKPPATASTRLHK
ncbi:MAG: hypothetical protein R2783_02590 [Gelidibacter sp.]